MKPFKTALLATAFALATTVAFAQTGVGASGNGSLGTTTGPTRAQPQAGADVNVNAAGHKAKVDANAADKAKINEGKTSGTVGAGVKGE